MGEEYCALREAAERRSAGAFYTPTALVRAMTRWALEREPDRVVDAGCGSGRFSLHAASAGVGVLAIDIDPISTLICRANLAAVGQDRVRVLHGDYLTASIPTIGGRTAYIGNPPYVRHHALSCDTKHWGRRVANDLRLPPPGLAGLHVYFMLATMLHAAHGDVGTFVTNAEWLDVGYGRTVRQALLDGLGGLAVHLVAPETTVFGDAMTTAAITCFEVGAEPDHVSMRVLHGLPGATELSGPAHRVPRTVLTSETRWSALCHAKPRTRRTSSRRLGDLVRVSRGVATGCNAFFVMSPHEARLRELEPWTTPALTRAREVLGAAGVVRADASKSVLLNADPDTDLRSSVSGALRRYIEEGEAAGVCAAYLCQHRKPWWRLDAKAAPMVATYMARRPPAFALNPDAMPSVNVVHGLFPKIPMAAEEMHALVAYLNAFASDVAGAGRVYHGGLRKLEPREMEAVPVPDLSDLVCSTG